MWIKVIKNHLNKMIINLFLKIDFTTSKINACILIIKWKKKFIIIGVYVDNLILKSKSLKVLELLKDQFMKKFNMKDLVEVKTIIG